MDLNSNMKPKSQQLLITHSKSIMPLTLETQRLNLKMNSSITLLLMKSRTDLLFQTKLIDSDIRSNSLALKDLKRRLEIA